MENAPSQSEAVALMVPATEVHWDIRQNSVRQDEWNLYRKGLKVVDQALDRLLKNPPAVVTLPQVARLLEVVNKLGRVASGLGFDSVEHRVPEDAAFMLEVDAILERVFTKPTEKTPALESSSAESLNNSARLERHEQN